MISMVIILLSIANYLSKVNLSENERNFYPQPAKTRNCPSVDSSSFLLHKSE